MGVLGLVFGLATLDGGGDTGGTSLRTSFRCGVGGRCGAGSAGPGCWWLLDGGHGGCRVEARWMGLLPKDTDFFTSTFVGQKGNYVSDLFGAKKKQNSNNGDGD